MLQRNGELAVDVGAVANPEGMADERRCNRERRQRQRRWTSAPTDRQGCTGTELKDDRRGQSQRRHRQAERSELLDPARPEEELRRATVEEYRREAETRCKEPGAGRATPRSSPGICVMRVIRRSPTVPADRKSTR